MPLVKEGDDLAHLIVEAANAAGEPLAAGDIVVIAQKVVSKAEGRMCDLADVRPSERAVALGRDAQKDPRLVELILQEAQEVLRVRPGVIVVAHKRGWVLANAGIDRSNVEGGDRDRALLLPEDPDASATAIRTRLERICGFDVAVVIADSIGRAWRLGTIGTAIGASGVQWLTDLRGRRDLYGRPLETTETGSGDEIAAAASLLMGQVAEGTPVVVVRGLQKSIGEGQAGDLVRPLALDMFR
ncbi:MAG TPA: coenzyme F420-0:L-glutamate ligase [Sphingomicrobium sp.]|nr:coenzyme F420-0:L-glutamate ligase [Sphingomicrobium sp.]